MSDDRVRFVSFPRPEVARTVPASVNNSLRTAMRLERAGRAVTKLAGGRKLSRAEMWGFLSLISAESRPARSTPAR